MSDASTLYRARATASGGTAGQVRTDDGKIDLQLSTPQELGGRGGTGTNAEQLLAAGYAACFYSALEHVATGGGTALPSGLSVGVEVALTRGKAAFQLELEVQVSAPGADAQVLRQLADAAAAVWPHAPGAAPAVRVSIRS